MTKRKDRFYVVIALGLVFVMAAFALLFVLGEKHRNAAVEELKTRASEIEARYHQQRTKNTPLPEMDAVPDPTESTETASPTVDSIEAYNEFSKKQIVIDANQTLEQLLTKDKNKSKEGTEEELSAFCANNQAFIEELRNIAATDGPFCELDTFKGSTRGMMPHQQQILEWMVVLKKHGAMAAANGDYEEATKDAMAIAAFAKRVGKEPAGISQGIRGALDWKLYNLISSNVQGENLTPEQTARIIEYAASFNGRNEIADAIALESTWTITETFDTIRSGHPDNPVARIYGSIGRPLLNRDEEIYVDFVERMRTVISLPYYEAHQELERIQEESENVSFIQIYANSTLEELVPAYCWIAESCARNEAQLGLMQIGLTVEQYHAQHGDYPQTLEEIAPALGGDLPLDPYTGQNYVYKPHGDNFTLYSARGNIIPPEENRTERGLDAQGNIVWRYTEE